MKSCGIGSDVVVRDLLHQDEYWK